MDLIRRKPDHALVIRSHKDEAEDISGDAGFIKKCGKGIFFALIDVLGHGIEAEEIARDVKIYFNSACQKKSLINIMDGLHKRLQGTRGAVVALGRYQRSNGKFTYVGLGNITTKIYANNSPITLVPREGVVGYIMSTLQEEEMVLPKGAVIIMHSDGLSGHIDFSDKISFDSMSANEIASSLVEQYGRKDDDVSCLVMKV